jgi:hypothetical protein
MHWMRLCRLAPPYLQPVHSSSWRLLQRSIPVASYATDAHLIVREHFNWCVAVGDASLRTTIKRKKPSSTHVFVEQANERVFAGCCSRKPRTSAGDDGARSAPYTTPGTVNPLKFFLNRTRSLPSALSLPHLRIEILRQDQQSAISLPSPYRTRACANQFPANCSTPRLRGCRQVETGAAVG